MSGLQPAPVDYSVDYSPREIEPQVVIRELPSGGVLAFLSLHDETTDKGVQRRTVLSSDGKVSVLLAAHRELFVGICNDKPDGLTVRRVRRASKGNLPAEEFLREHYPTVGQRFSKGVRRLFRG